MGIVCALMMVAANNEETKKPVKSSLIGVCTQKRTKNGKPDRRLVGIQNMPYD